MSNFLDGHNPQEEWTVDLYEHRCLECRNHLGCALCIRHAYKKPMAGNLHDHASGAHDVFSAAAIHIVILVLA